MDSRVGEEMSDLASEDAFFEGFSNDLASVNSKEVGESVPAESDE